MAGDPANGVTSSLVDDLERRAIAAYLDGDEETSEALWEQAHAESMRGNEVERAARAVFWLALDLFNRGEWARASGWVARGLRLLERRPDCVAFGLLCVLASRQHLKLGDIDAATNAARRAVELARQSGDPELKLFSRLLVAQLEARRGRFADALALFDELMVSVTVDETSPIVVGVVYCAVIDGCYALFDLGRAREWTTALSRWCNLQTSAVVFRGNCLVQRATTMRLSGAWSDALAEAKRACDWSVAHPNTFKQPAGPAFYELGELYRLRGQWSEAEAAYRRAGDYGPAPEPGATLLRFAQGHMTAAVASIRRLLNERQTGISRVSILHAAVDILTSSGDVATAREAADEVARLTAPYPAPASRALASYTMGAVCLAEGDASTALSYLRESWTLWQELEAPYESARVRVLLAQACRQLGDHAAAELELDAARRVFERLSAEPDVRAVDVLRRRASGDGGRLTARELQVIELVAEGKTNRSIGEKLSISERTVDRHVSNILLKLDLPSRSAVTAYAYEHRLV